MTILTCRSACYVCPLPRKSSYGTVPTSSLDETTFGSLPDWRQYGKEPKVVSSDEDIGTTMFGLYNCTVARIEEDAFDMLLLLRQVSLDAGIPLNMKMTSARKEHFRLLYCDCEYKWLRVYFEMIPKKKQENYRPYFWWHFISLCHYPKYVRTHWLWQAWLDRWNIANTVFCQRPMLLM